MSTTKIREMVATYGRSMSVIQAKRLKAAVLAEVEALEKAAGTFRELKEIGQCGAEDAAHMDKTFIGIARGSES